jgi:hypothetical protein
VPGNAAAALASRWNPEQHPRDAAGRFADQLTFADNVHPKIADAARAAADAYHAAGVDVGPIHIVSESGADASMTANSMASAAKDRVYVSHDRMTDDAGLPRGSALTPDEARRAIMVHEFGHVLHRRLGSRGAEVSHEQVPPRDLGYAIGEGLDKPMPRWQHDVLRDANGSPRSAYAGENPYEWSAEAIADGVTNGAAASESGRRMISMFRRHA